MKKSHPYENATPEQCEVGAWWWCIHHGIMLESLTEPIGKRVAYIREHKPSHEVETRLRAMRPVEGPLPVALVKADAAWRKAVAAWQKAYADRQKTYADWQKAYAAWQKAYAARQKAYADRQKTYADCAAEIAALFAVECADVVWGPKGLVFPEVQS